MRVGIVMIDALITGCIKFGHLMHVPTQNIRIQRHLAKPRIGEIDVTRAMDGQIVWRVEGFVILVGFRHLKSPHWITVINCFDNKLFISCYFGHTDSNVIAIYNCKFGPFY